MAGRTTDTDTLPPVSAVDTAVKLTVAVVPLLTAVVGSQRGSGQLRSKILRDAEILQKLPESEARTTMLELLDQETQKLRTFDVDARRDWSMLVVALIVAPALGYLTFWA